jgi:hypothetical protein
MNNLTFQRREPALISFVALRRIIGILGISFPFIMLIGSAIYGDCTEVQRSLSVYYHTGMQHAFTGILCAVGLFLFTYKGYDLRDDLTGNLAGLFALIAAFCPTSMKVPPSDCIPNPIDNPVLSGIHDFSALGFMLTLSCFSLFLFRKTDKSREISPMKRNRNKWYLAMGITMLVCITLIIVYSLLNKYCFGRHHSALWLVELHPIFWLESVTLVAFGISWFIKGRTIMTDEEEQFLPPLSNRKPREHIL